VLVADGLEERIGHVALTELRSRQIRYTVTRADDFSREALSSWLGEEEAVLIPCIAIFDDRVIRQAVTYPGAAQTLLAVTTRDNQGTEIVRGTADLLWPMLPKEHQVPELSQSAVRPPSSTLRLQDGLWVPLSAGLAEVEQRLFAGLGRHNDGFLSPVLDRKVSRAVTRRLAHTAVTPNQITLFSFLLGLLSVWLLMWPGYWPQVGGATLFLVSVIIDACDGEVARLKYLESDFGAKFDIIADNIVHLLLFPAIALGLYRETQQALYPSLAVVTLIGVLCSIGGVYAVIFRPSNGLAGGNGKRTAFMKFYERLAGRDFAYVLLVLAVCNQLHWFLWAAAVGTYVFAGGLAVAYALQRRNTPVYG
jgi:phosphatidylglycerophosphate synthase